MESIANTPKPPYYAVIFTSVLFNTEVEYNEMAEKMDELAKKQSGYLGIESVRDNSLLGITVSYWIDEESILDWKNNVDHKLAQRYGKEKWYQSYTVRITIVKKEYGFEG